MRECLNRACSRSLQVACHPTHRQYTVPLWTTYLLYMLIEGPFVASLPNTRYHLLSVSQTYALGSGAPHCAQRHEEGERHRRKPGGMPSVEKLGRGLPLLRCLISSYKLSTSEYNLNSKTVSEVPGPGEYNPYVMKTGRTVCGLADRPCFPISNNVDPAVSTSHRKQPQTAGIHQIIYCPYLGSQP